MCDFTENMSDDNYNMISENEYLNKTNKKLNSVIVAMKREIHRLSTILNGRTGSKHLSLEILEYFFNCNSIQKTAYRFDYNAIDLFHQIPEWDGCSDGLQNADDYIQYRIEAYGRNQYEADYNEYSDEELCERKRTPDMTNILADYNNGKTSLYDIADRYDLWINNLFRLLKENGAIQDETDAIGYADFYSEYVGNNTMWDGTERLGLIEMFYSSI
jgi:hypothetical protein